MERRIPIIILEEKLEKLKIKSDKLKEIESKGFIGNRFRKYCEHLLILDHLSEEMKVYSSFSDRKSAIHSGLEMKKTLDNLAGLYIYETLLNPESDEFYKELYLLGKSKYDDAVNMTEKILLKLN